MQSKKKRIYDASFAPIKKGPMSNDRLMHIYAGAEEEGAQDIQPLPPEIDIDGALKKMGAEGDEANKLKKSRRKALELMTEK